MGIHSLGEDSAAFCLIGDTNMQWFCALGNLNQRKRAFSCPKPAKHGVNRVRLA